ncbi:MAG: hypothetical protein U0997_10380 [Sulfurimicrobium sp.]|nr:hypothetical protein [Sulfurimicrobium sp.]
MDHIEIGNMIEHPEHGSGVVTYVGENYIGFRFDSGGNALLKRSSFENQNGEENSVLPAVEEKKMAKADLPWPDSTFKFEGANARHFMGAHWEPFVDDSTELLKRIPEILPQALPQALPQTGYGEHHPATKKIPPDWATGYQLVWPLRVNGMSLMIRSNESQKQSELVSVFPFFAEGSQSALTLRQVDVWESECEAQITAGWGEAEIAFFDTQYLLNRAWYEAGKRYDFILTGLAYSACPSTIFKMPVHQNPEELAWLKQLAAERGEEPPEEMTEINLTGMAMFLPIDAWDKDDYKFRAPIKEVKAFQDFLGQDGWRVRATVFRFGDADADLDIVITRRAWGSDAPPQVGQDIEGSLWLQGYLWYPHK